MSCLTDHEVARFTSGGASPAQASRVDDHLDGCASCRTLVAASARLQGGEASGPIEPGLVVGRYVIEERLGLGAAGEVFAARDTELHRRVALKMLHPAGQDSVAEERLRREARAMARAAHPNTVAVYEVGTFRDRLFIAMELVDGRTLDEWLRARKRGWREVVRMLIQAGEGLVAAHDRGLVHRDFKPSNVLIDVAGRARVSDFGLVKTDGDERVAAGSAEPSPHEIHLTQAGAVLGTPAYMSPEQHRGEAVGPRADQFSFCVALYEAVLGVRPFAGTTYAEVRASVLAGRPAEPESGLRMPSALERLVVRGLAADPQHRHSTLRDLLLRLKRLVGRRRRRAAIAVASTALLVVAFAGGWLGWVQGRLAREPERPRPPKSGVAATTIDPCAQAGSHWDAIWGPEAREAFEEGLAGTWPEQPGVGADQPLRSRWAGLGPSRAQGVALLVEGYGGRWVGGRRAACRATYVDRRQDAQHLERQLLCYERHRLQADSLIEAGKEGQITTAAAEKAILALQQRLGDCALGSVSKPGELAVHLKERWWAIQRQLQSARRLHWSGARAGAATRSRAATLAARALGYEPLVSEALLVQGLVLGPSEPVSSREALLTRAHAAAQASRYAPVAGDAAALLAWSLAARGRHIEARTWEITAREVYRELARPRACVVRLELIRALGSMTQGHSSEAIRLAEKAVADGDALALAMVDRVELLAVLGRIYRRGGDAERARSTLERARRAALETADTGLIQRVRDQLRQPLP